VLTSITEIGEYLIDKAGSIADPVLLPVQIDLGIMTEADSGWRQLLEIINKSGKYAALDLTFSTLNNGTKTIFNADGVSQNISSNGKEKITSIILPDTATILAGGFGQYVSGFRYFTALTKIIGRNIITILGHTFGNSNKNLISVDFPNATSIGPHAFHSCTSLVNVNIPSASIIYTEAFCDTRVSDLSIRLGVSPPAVGKHLFNTVNKAKNVTVRIPDTDAAKADYDFDGSQPGNYNNSSTGNWGSNFKGGNNNIILSFETY